MADNRSPERRQDTGRSGTRGTVIIAGTANALVGVIKLAAGIMVGSSAMLAEVAHSAADTLNQALLASHLSLGLHVFLDPTQIS